MCLKNKKYGKRSQVPYSLDDSSITYQNGIRIPISEKKYKVAPQSSSLICIGGGSAGRKIAFTNQEVCFVNKLACLQSGFNNQAKGSQKNNLYFLNADISNWITL